MTESIIFTARVDKTPGKGGWHYVLLPDEVRDGLRNQSGKNSNVPVLVKIGQTTWPSTTMRMGQQRWFVAVKADVRKAEVVSEGDEVTVSILPDTKRL